MALLRSLFAERRAISPQTLFRTGADTLDLTGGNAGVNVTQDSALTYSGIWACVRLIASDISTLPVDAYRKVDGAHVQIEGPPWLEVPDPEDPSITRIDHFAQVAISLLLDGNAFVLGTPTVLAAERLEVLNPRRVEVRKPGRSPQYRVWDDRGRFGDVYSPLDITHIKINAKPGALRGMSPIEANQGSIGISLAAQKWVERFFGQGTMMPGFVTTPAGTAETAAELGDSLAKRHGGWKRAGILGVLWGGAKYEQTGVTPKDAELTALFDHQLEEGARIYGIPPFMVGSQEPAGVAYASAVERAQHYIDHCLIHYIAPIEAAYTRMIPGDGRLMVPGSDTYMRFNLNALLKGNPKDRADFYKAMRELGVMNADDIAHKEDMRPPADGSGKRYWEPIANWAPVGAAGTLPTAGTAVAG